MKRILIVSDTHGNIRSAIECCENSGRLDGIIHLGDNVKDADDLAYISGLYLVKIRGNCDLWDTDAPDSSNFSIDGFNIHCVHGHMHGVKCGYAEILSYAQNLDCDILLFGHTHRQDYFWAGKTLCVNPGSIARPRGDSFCGYAVLETDESKMTLYLHNLEEKTSFKIEIKRNFE